MWALGATFIAGAAAVYFLFLAAWLNLLLFLGSVVWIRAAIGVVAVGGGLWHLHSYLRNDGAVCEVTAPQQRRRVFERLRELASEKPGRRAAPAGAGHGDAAATAVADVRLSQRESMRLRHSFGANHSCRLKATGRP